MITLARNDESCILTCLENSRLEKPNYFNVVQEKEMKTLEKWVFLLILHMLIIFMDSDASWGSEVLLSLEHNYACTETLDVKKTSLDSIL